MAGIGTIASLANDLGFTAQGNICWGMHEGYWFGIVQGLPRSNAFHIYTAARFPETADKAAISAALDTLSAAKAIKSYSILAHGYEIVIQPGFTGIQSRKVADAMHALTDAIRAQGGQPACFHCGSAEALSFAQLNDMPLSLCTDCQTRIEEAMSRQEGDHAQLPNNYARGILGALLGALLGGAIWVGIGLLGYIAAIAGTAISFFAVKGYTLLGGKLNRTAVVLICLICVAVFALAQFATSDALLIRDLINEGYEPNYGEIFKATFEIPFFDEDTTSAFIKDSLLGLVFMVLGSWGTLRAVGRQASKPAGSLVRLQG